MRKLTEDQLQEIIGVYHNTLAKDLAMQFKVSIHAIYRIAIKHGLKKDPEWVRQNAKDNFHENHPARMYLIKPGTTPPNKGRKMEEFMSPEQQKKFLSNSFRPGHIPKNHKPVGSERIDVDGYVWVKIAEPKTWKQKNHLVWEQHFGAVPKGMNIQFKDGNRLNCTIENLYIISKSEQLRTQNSFMVRYPEDIQKNIRALGQLTRKINTLKKSSNEEEQRNDPCRCKGGSL